MKQTIKIYKGDEFMDYSGEARMIKVLDKHFDDYYVESFVPSFNEENDCDEWIRGGEFVMMG